MKSLCCFIIEEKKAKFEDVSNLTAVVPEYESIERPNHSSNTAQMATIAESISILWGSVSRFIVIVYIVCRQSYVFLTHPILILLD